jgi:hypothetical protein
MTISVKFSPIFQDEQLGNDGLPLVGGLLSWYLAGTSTGVTVYADSLGISQQTQPIVLNVRGEPPNPIWLPTGQTYKAVLTDSLSNPIRTIDNISPINDTSTSVALSEWQVLAFTPTYQDGTHFTVVGDQTATLTVGRRLKMVVSGINQYASIVTSVFSAGVTTITLLNDISPITSGLSSISYGILDPTNQSIPTSTVALNNITSLQSVNGTSIGGFRNRIINGAMLVDQRNAGAAQTITAGAALAYTVDRFYAYCTGANVTGQQVAGAIANTTRYQFTGAASVTAIGFGTRLESVDTANLAGGNAALSVRLKSSSLTTVTWSAYYANTKDTFGTLASPTRTVIATGSFAVTNTESNYTAVFAVPSAATTGIEILFTAGALLASQTLTLGNVQFESGSASSFEQRPVMTELALCQRYYETGRYITSQYATVTIAYTFTVAFKVTKRAAPTITVPSFTNNTNCFTYTATSLDATSFQSNATPNATGLMIWDFNWTALSEL